MKKTDLEKNKMQKTHNAVKIASVPDRFGSGSGLADRKEQRKLDQAAGLIPFACKLPGELLKTLHARVAAEQTNMNDLVAGLLENALGKAVATAAVKATPTVEKVAAAAVAAKTTPAPKVAKVAKVATVAETTKTRK